MQVEGLPCPCVLQGELADTMKLCMQRVVWQADAGLRLGILTTSNVQPMQETQTKPEGQIQ